MEVALAAYVDASHRFEPITDQQIIGHRVLDEAGEDIEPPPGHQHPETITTEADARALARDYAAETLEQIAELDPKDPDFQRQVDIFVQESMSIKPIYGGQQVHSLKITPAMKEEVLGKGQPLYQIRRKADSPPFVSQLRNVVADEKMFPPSMKSPSVVNTLMKYGVKAAEIQDTGLAKFLADKPRVTREELLDFIDMNMVKVEEVVRTDDAIDQVEELSFTEPEPDEETGEYPEEPEWFAQGMSVYYKIDQSGRVNEGEGRFKLEIFDRQDFDGPPVNTASGRTVDELIRYANEQEREYARTVGDVKYEEYVLPGAAKDYRELLITLPRPKLATFKSRSDYDAAITKAGPHFDSPHWDEPNVLAHIRFDERTDAEGKRTLFIEEVQSDWHIAGRKEGYSPGMGHIERLRQEAVAAENNYNNVVEHAPDAERKALLDAADELLEAARTALEEARQINARGVPDAPFKDTWYELAMKRAIRWAAEHGFDSISWTTGDQQAERYDLSKHIDTLYFEKGKGDASGGVSIDAKKSGKTVINGFYPVDRLSDFIGSELAAKINGSVASAGNMTGLD
ncbi:MAG TPA: hypothetical protein PKV70_03285, partial [Thermodesulfobacteriota bacterium]|nr:hypothetical protein [Thermodesulfobacteriota bacterium]